METSAILTSCDSPLVESGKNKLPIFCRLCGCSILLAHVAIPSTKNVSSPLPSSSLLWDLFLLLQRSSTLLSLLSANYSDQNADCYPHPNKQTNKQISVPDRKGEPMSYSNSWIVKNQFDFENMAFTHSTKECKYLTCADCEGEVIGVHFLSDPTTFYIVHDLVLYDSDQAKSLKASRKTGDFTLPQEFLSSLIASSSSSSSPSTPQSLQ